MLADSLGTFDGFTFGNTGFGCADRSIPSLNDTDDVAFFADGSMPGPGDEAIFLWDGTLHRLLGNGDMVGGAEITHIRYFGGGLNSAGDIAFAADLSGGDPLFVVLAPRTSAAVPEPASLLLLGSGLAALVWSRRYRRR